MDLYQSTPAPRAHLRIKRQQKAAISVDILNRHHGSIGLQEALRDG